MQTLYLGCLALGVIFAVVSVIVGDLIGNVLDGIFDVASFDFLNPAVLAGESPYLAEQVFCSRVTAGWKMALFLPCPC